MLDSTGFHEPDWESDYDWEAYASRAPSHMTVRGVFMKGVYDFCRARRVEFPGDPDYSILKQYPNAEYQALTVKAARAVYPSLPLRLGLREIGKTVYVDFASSPAGKALFAMAGSDFSRAAFLASKAYGIAASIGSCRVTFSEHRTSCIAELHDVWNYPNTLQVGVWEGALDAFGQHGKVRVREYDDISRVDLFVDWSEP